MNVDVAAAPPFGAQQGPQDQDTDLTDMEMRRAEQQELSAEVIQSAIVVVFVLGLGVLALGALVLNRVQPRLFGVALVILALAVLAQTVFRRHAIAAAALLTAGLLVTLAAVLSLFPGLPVAPWSSLVVFLASAMLGRRVGIAVALIATAILIGDVYSAAIALPPATAASALALSWSSVLLSWLTARPTTTALGWAWASYLRALREAGIARERQAEYARLSKTLAESNYRLQQINLEVKRARQAALEARRLKAQFATAVSHELRTPLNLIIGFCEMMVLSPSSAYGQRLPANYQGDLEAIYRNACHISALVDDILDLSQIDADRMALHKDWTAIQCIVGDAVATVESLFRDRGLALDVQAPSELPDIYVDQTRVRQILINLLANAARWTEQGGATVRVEVADESVVLSVEDTGPGIAPEDVKNVFDEFRQVSGATWRRGGTGLGLTVSKRFAELHGGSMWAESDVGVGSAFRLQLPRSSDAPVAAPEERRGRGPRGVAPRGDRRVLVIGDSEQGHKVFERYLDGYTVLHAPSLEQGRHIARETPLQAVIVAAAGAEAAQTMVQAMRGVYARLPVISCVLQTPHKATRQLGAFDYFVKPVSREQLRSTLRRLPARPRQALIVDDDPEMTRLLARMVKSLLRGCSVTCLHDGRSALASIRAQRPDFLLLDLMLPELDGYAVLETLHADSELNAIPTIIITALEAHDETVRAQFLQVTRHNGMTVAEVMRWVSKGLDALLAPSNSAPAAPEGPAALPASGGNPSPPEIARASVPAAPSR